jgi:hypothetical protein
MLSLDVAISKEKALYIKELFVVFRRILGLVTSLHQLNFLRKKPLLAPVGFENALGFRSVTLQWLAASARVIGLGLPKSAIPSLRWLAQAALRPLRRDLSLFGNSLCPNAEFKA